MGGLCHTHAQVGVESNVRGKMGQALELGSGILELVLSHPEMYLDVLKLIFFNYWVLFMIPEC